MKTILSVFIFSTALLCTLKTNAQTTLYADSVIAFSSNYYGTSSAQDPGWSEIQVLGSPDTYPQCGDIQSAWTNPFTDQRAWIVVHFAGQLFVDTVKIYETNAAGAVDTIYLRNASTGNWNTIYTATAVTSSQCAVLTVGMPQTTYLVDALRFALDASVSVFSEYDAVSITQNATVSIPTINRKNMFRVYPNPSAGEFTIRLNDPADHAHVKIYSVLGPEVYQKIDIRQTELLQPELEKGIYFIEVTDQLNKSSFIRLVID